MGRGDPLSLPPLQIQLLCKFKSHGKHRAGLGEGRLRRHSARGTRLVTVKTQDQGAPGNWVGAQRCSSGKLLGVGSRDLSKPLPVKVCGGSSVPGIKDMGSNMPTLSGCVMLGQSPTRLSPFPSL